MTCTNYSVSCTTQRSQAPIIAAEMRRLQVKQCTSQTDWPNSEMVQRAVRVGDGHYTNQASSQNTVHSYPSAGDVQRWRAGIQHFSERLEFT